MKLNLGCGPYLLEDFVNIDIRDLEGVDVIADVTKLPLPDASADFIYGGHILEHIEDWEKALEEWKRVLKPGGKIMIVIPDVPKAIALYGLDQLSDKLLNQIVYGDGAHKKIWWGGRLAFAMAKAGFVELKSIPYDCPYMSGHAPWQSGIEGTKIEGKEESNEIP